MNLVVNVEIYRRVNTPLPPSSSFILNDVFIFLSGADSGFSWTYSSLPLLILRQFRVVVNN